MDNASTVAQRIHYPFPPTEVIVQLSQRISNPNARNTISELSIVWAPTESEFNQFRKIGKSAKDAIKTFRYIPVDSRTPEHFMTHNGPAEILYSKLMDSLAESEPYYTIATFTDLCKSYMLPGVNAIQCDNCDRVILEVEHRVTSKTLADIYSMELKQEANLCPFEFIAACAEIEYLYPEAISQRTAPTLPDGRPVIWVGDPGWMTHSDEYRKLSLQFQGRI